MTARMRGIVLLLATVSAPSTVLGAGIAARFGTFPVIEGRDLEVTIEIEDEAGAVGQVEVELRAQSRSAWHSAVATEAEPGRWRATYPAELIPPSPGVVELRASILGARGGLLLELGFDAAHRLEVATAAQAQAERRLLSRKAEERDLDLTAYIGGEARAGSSARIRGTLSVGLSISPHQELIVGVSVGPAFSPPAVQKEGGPIVFGFEADWRVYTLEIDLVRIAPFVELFAGGDARFPGLDPAAGARVGAALALGADTRLDASIGGAVALFGAAGADETELGFMGGARLALRFGSGPSEEPRR
jgi:hypothetical protein